VGQYQIVLCHPRSSGVGLQTEHASHFVISAQSMLRQLLENGRTIQAPFPVCYKIDACLETTLHGNWRVLGIRYRIKLVDRRSTFVTAVVVAHLLVNIAHGLAHHELRVGLALPATVFVILVVLIAPLLALGLIWTAKKRLGLLLLSLSMSGSFLFGLYHHFLVMSTDHVDSQPWSPGGLAFGLTAYLLLITEAIGTYVGIHFLRKT
jgi:hypothetical protein